jgi:SPP1 gp7 family putative phage head morphogenesis protein
MNSKEYWAKREAEALTQRITDEKQYDRYIKTIYSNMLDACQKEINAFYGRYAAKEGITLAEAKKRVRELDIKEYERKAKRYVKEKNFSAQANEEMSIYNATMKINRLEMLKANIGLELIDGHNELERFMGDILQGRTEDELKRQAGILGKTIKNNAQKAHAIVNSSFHNATFSDRIWQYQSLMKSDLSKMLQSGLIQGKNPRALAKDLRKYWYGNDPKTNGGAVYCMERLMRTELARVQTEAQKQSFERNGFTEYEFIVNSGCCDICAGLNGKHFKVAKMMPGENAPPIHPHCRCSTAAWTDSEEYEAWLDYLSKGGTTAEWEKLQNESQYLRNNLPKAYKDTRNIGNPISKEDLDNVINYAKSKGVQIGTVDKPTGGFETYCGDKSVLKEVIDELAKQQNSSLFKKSGAKNAILLYDNVLGYDQYGNGIIDLSKIDIGAFASTKGRVITLNKFMFDDSKYLASEYRKSANTGFFVKGTDYKHIVIHEIGHIIAKSSPGLANKTLNVINKEARTKGISTHQYIVENISRYAAKLNGSFEYGELAAEINSLLTKNGNSDIIKLLIKEGVI